MQKHARVTGHRTDDLSQICYICNKKCENFDDLMRHQKQAHTLEIILCRFYQDTGYCKFESQCYHRHSGSNQPQHQPQGFQKGREHPPPDPPMMDLIVMLKEMMATYMQIKESNVDKNRSLGN